MVKSGDMTYLLIDMHHIISDGVSMSVLTKEFAALYNEQTLEPLKIQYKDFAAWQNDLLKSEKMKEQEEYWLNIFSDEVPILNMPTDYERPVVQSFEGDNVNFEASEDLTIDLKNLAKTSKSTMQIVLLSALNILLSKYSEQEDIIVGVAIAGRPHADVQNIMGMFVNTLALRNKPIGNMSYIDFLKEVKKNSLDAYENQNYQIETLVEKLNLSRDMSRNSLFDVVLNMIDLVDNKTIELKDIELKPYGSKNGISKLDLTLSAQEHMSKLRFNLEYCIKLFNKESMEMLGRHYINILETIVHSPEIILSKIEMLSESEKGEIINDLSGPNRYYQENMTFQQLFENQVEKSPDNIALVFEGEELTYKEINEKANGLARALRDKGVKPDDIVGIMLNRSVEMIVSILAVLKSGGAYLPINPSTPKERIEYMLMDSKVNILLSEKDLIKEISFKGEILDLNEANLCEGVSHNLKNVNTSKDLAYIIYTSGTTGNPKAVMIEHVSIVETLLWSGESYGFKSSNTVLPIADYVFDGFITSFFAPIVSGSKIVFIKDLSMSASELIKLITKHRVTHWMSVPSVYSAVLELLNFENSQSLEVITLAGEDMPRSYIDRTKEINSTIKFCNEYGPTENSVITTILSDVQSDNISIGKPKANSKIYIVDRFLNLKPKGVPGELCISGRGLARGYLNNPEITLEKFIDNPFEEGARLYKTGDLAKYLPDGNIKFLGRIDNQVKLRGLRIEIGEIESRLLMHDKVKEVAVVLKENNSKEKYICAYLVSEEPLEELNLKSYLRGSLPEYMIPSYFIGLDKMPLNSNGKLDKKSLPNPDFGANLKQYEAPRNEVEEALVEIWSEVLGIENIGINHNFFEIGGHSLKATVLLSKIHKKLNKEIPLKELFKSPTIKGISEYLNEAQENIYSIIKKAAIREYYEASSAQKRMYILQQFDGSSTAYNMPAIFELQGSIDIERITQVFKELILRHEVLRTYFETIDGEIVQKIVKDFEFNIEYKEVNEDIHLVIDKFIRSFDLGKAPLFRVEMVKTQGQTYLLIDIHHIISDGVSMNILIKEFVSIYNGEILEPLSLQYKDFALWQNDLLKSEALDMQEKYWVNRFEHEVPVLSLPTDYERPIIKSFEGNRVDFQISEKSIAGLRRLTMLTQSTTQMVLLSVFNILLSKYSGVEDVVVGIPIAGRTHAELQNIMGMFINTLAIRNTPEGNKSYIDFLNEVKENSLQGYENQSYQLEALVDRLNLNRDMSRNPLFDVVLNMVNVVDDPQIISQDIIFKPYNNSSVMSKFDLSLHAVDSTNNLTLAFEYAVKLFKKDTIERLSRHYLNILEIVLDNPQISLKDIDMLSEEERSLILFKLNDTKAAYPSHKTIQELFEDQVNKTPNNTAVIYEGSSLTYRELNEKQIALLEYLELKALKRTP